jgi:hypothetical protein
VFRLVKYPTELIIREDILAAIDAQPQEGGWEGVIKVEST